MEFLKVKIVTFVPLANTDTIRAELGKAGAGVIGEYTYCSFSVTGNGRFLPSANSDPHIGKPGQLEVVEEERIEIICNRKDAKKVIAALKIAHPYEEVAFDIYPLIDEAQL